MYKENLHMFIYNVTVNVQPSIQEDWIQWMVSTHIPEVLSSGCFTGNRICKLLNVADEGATYAVQYTFRTMDEMERYQKEFAPALQEDHKKRYGDKALAFRTLMEVVNES